MPPGSSRRARPERRRGAAAGAAVTVAVLLMTVAATAPVAPPVVRSWITWMLFGALHVLFAHDAFSIAADRRATSATRWLWRSFGVAALLFLLGDLVQLGALASRPYDMSIATGILPQQVLLLAGMGVVVLAATAVPVRTGNGRQTAQLMLDIGVVVVAVAAVTIAWQTDVPGRGALELVLDGPIMFAVAALVLLKLVLAPDRPFSAPAGWLLGAAAAGEAVLATISARPELGSSLALMNGVALACNVLLALGARVQRSSVSEDPGETASRPSRLRLVRLPYVAVLTTNLVALSALAQGGLTSRTWLLVQLTAVSTVLVLVRQFLALREKHLLLKDLHRALEERDALTRALEHRATHDSLTGLVERPLFQKMLDDRLGSRRAGEQGPCVLMLDLDGFKDVNDGHGHAAGDSVLTSVADRLRTCVRDVDEVARLGGDEFAVLLDGDLAAAEHAAWRMVDLLGRPFEVDGAEVTIGASIGIAVPGLHTRTSDELLHRADLAMYAAKAAGKNGVVVDEVLTRAATVPHGCGLP